MTTLLALCMFLAGAWCWRHALGSAVDKQLGSNFVIPSIPFNKFSNACFDGGLGFESDIGN